MPCQLPLSREAAISYWGLGRYFGEPVPQNKSGHLLGHVCDLGLDPSNPNHRIYATSAAQPFHTDSADIVALLCLREAMEGGDPMGPCRSPNSALPSDNGDCPSKHWSLSRTPANASHAESPGLSSWCSSVSIYNHMLQHRRDLLEVLMSDFCVDRKGEIPPGKGPFYRMPVVHMHEGLVSIIYARGFIEVRSGPDTTTAATDKRAEAHDGLRPAGCTAPRLRPRAYAPSGPAARRGTPSPVLGGQPHIRQPPLLHPAAASHHAALAAAPCRSRPSTWLTTSRAQMSYGSTFNFSLVTSRSSTTIRSCMLDLPSGTGRTVGRNATSFDCG